MCCACKYLMRQMSFSLPCMYVLIVVVELCFASTMSAYELHITQNAW